MNVQISLIQLVLCSKNGAVLFYIRAFAIVSDVMVDELTDEVCCKEGELSL